jgi:hypothetical protein
LDFPHLLKLIVTHIFVSPFNKGGGFGISPPLQKGKDLGLAPLAKGRGFGFPPLAKGGRGDLKKRSAKIM